MDSTHIHLLLTHFPIIGTLIGIGILAYGTFSKNISIQKLSLSIFVIMAVLAIPVFLSGEGAAETVENLPDVSETIIEEHEELAEKAIWLMGLLGILSLVNLYAIYKKLDIAKSLTYVTLIVSLLTFALFAKVGNLGGQIRHSEIRTGSVMSSGNEANQVNSGEEDDD